MSASTESANSEESKTVKAVNLSLSGGGIRAMAFHCGVLRWLAETQRLEHVAHVSSVSGGTLIAGLVMAANAWHWPTSAQYLSQVSPQLRAIITTKDVARTALRLLSAPRNWRYLLSRANVLSEAIEQCWSIEATMADLPSSPYWSLNGTTAETGRRFRFKLDSCGDYELGYADARRFRLADAMAMSAALPGVIGPLAITAAAHEWKRRPYWDAPVETEAVVQLPYKRLHLYDGGLYDNLALEPMLDPGTQQIKGENRYLVCSDAGAPLKRVAPGLSLSPYRALRVLDISLDQARSLRVRALANFLTTNPGAGVYAQIGSNPPERINFYGKQNPDAAGELLKQDWLRPEDISRACRYPTTLRPLKEGDFDCLERHGYESIQWPEQLFTLTGTVPNAAHIL